MSLFMSNSNLFKNYFKKYNTILSEQGLNVLDDKYQIKSPELNELTKNIYIINTNNEILNKLLN